MRSLFLPAEHQLDLVVLAIEGRVMRYAHFVVRSGRYAGSNPAIRWRILEPVPIIPWRRRVWI